MSLLQGNSTHFTPEDIPLHCNVCSKQPTFSDLSHLLTHLASKGHLSAVFKLKNAAFSDPEARNTLQEYKHWEATNGLKALINERLNQKDKKKKANGGNPSRRSTREWTTRPCSTSTPADSLSIANTGSSRNTPASGGPRNVRRPAGQSRLDPQLNRRGPAQPSRSTTPLPLSYFDPTNFSRSLAPIQASWGHGSFQSGSPSTIKQESVSSFDDDEYVDADYTPKSRRVLRQRHHNSISAASFADDASFDNSDDLEIVDDPGKLKGKVWPGMSLFDSATPDMKRKRNQKKDPCVLRELQANSKSILATEFVHDASISVQKTRDIDGFPPSDDDLIEGETEPETDHQEKKRPRRIKTRQPLIKKEPNTGRVTRGSKIAAPLYSSRPRRGPYYDGGDDEDDDLTYQARPVKRRAGLSIHRDNSGPEITFNRPAPMEYLNSGYPLRGNGHNLVQHQHMYEHPVPLRPHARQPSFSQSMAFRPAPYAGQPPAYPSLNMFGQQGATNNAPSHNFGNFNQAFGPSPMTMPQHNNQLFQASAGGDLGLYTSMFDFSETLPERVDSAMGDTDLTFELNGESA